MHVRYKIPQFQRYITDGLIPVFHQGTISEEDLEWKGKLIAAKIMEPRWPASLAHHSDAALREACCCNLAIEAGLDQIVATQGARWPQISPAGRWMSEKAVEAELPFNYIRVPLTSVQLGYLSYNLGLINTCFEVCGTHFVRLSS